MTAAAWAVVAKAIAAGVLAGVLALGVTRCQEHYRDQGRTEVQAKWDKAKAEDERLAANARAAKQASARAEEQQKARKAEENARAQHKRDQALAAGNAGVQRSADGLRGDVAAADGHSSARRAAGTCAAADAEAHEAATARALLGTCSDRYRAVAKDAAELAAAVNDLQDHVIVVQPEAAALLEEAAP